MLEVAELEFLHYHIGLTSNSMCVGPGVSLVLPNDVKRVVEHCLADFTL